MVINLYLIRHGESEYNIDHNIRLTKFDWDVKLTKNGILQSEKMGEVLKNDQMLLTNECFNFVYVSPFKRTLQTFKKSKIEKNIKIDKLYIEPLITEQSSPLHYGVYLKKTYDQFLKSSHENKFWAKYLDFESGFEVYQRTELFKNKLEKNINEAINLGYISTINVFIYSHGFFLRMLLTNILKTDKVNSFIKMKNLKNCEIIKLTMNDNENSDIFSDIYGSKFIKNKLI